MFTTTIKRSFVLAVAFVVTLLMQLALTTPAHAASRVWDGEGADDKFSTAANWVGDVVPVGGDAIDLDTTGMASGGTFNNDLVADTSFQGITLSGQGSGVFTLSGNPIIVTTGLSNAATYNYASFIIELDITSTAINLSVIANSKVVIGAGDGTNTLDLGAFTLSKSGAYPLVINSVLSGSGGITVADGDFVADENNSFTGTITVGDGGTLKGNGTVGNVTVSSGGTVAPGLSPGCLSTGNISYSAGSTYIVEIDGATVCTQYDQTQVSGSIDLGNATLDIQRLSTYTPADGTIFIIIDNSGEADGVPLAVTGTFNGLAEGATRTVDGVVYTISYAGGDGNDVVLSTTAVTAPNTGFGSATANYMFIALFTAASAAALVVVGRKLQKAKNQITT